MSSSRIKIAVTGLNGQIVTSLIQRAPKDIEIIALGRPQLDLARRGLVLTSLRNVGCDAIINAAAYTKVDQAEDEESLAMRINGEGAESVALVAAELNVPLIHFSTDYVFDGRLSRPYIETDPTAPLGVYGRSKLEGEKKILKTHKNSVIIRTAWVYSPYGTNFVKTMLRLASEKEVVSVVDDQVGNPTSALDLADQTIWIIRRLLADTSSELRGIFHLTGQGEASWADMAEDVFKHFSRLGFTAPVINRIKTSQYPTRALRPLNSRLNNKKIIETYGLKSPNWKESLGCCIDELKA